MTTLLNMMITGRTTLLPEILPADPCAPESIKYKPRGLRYGALGKVIMAICAKRETQPATETEGRLRPDFGLGKSKVQDSAVAKKWKGPTVWREHKTLEKYAVEAMHLFSQPRAL